MALCSVTNSTIFVPCKIPYTYRINPKRPGGWHNVPQNFHLSLILLAIVDPDGNRTIFSRALLDADFGPQAAGAYAKLNFRPKKVQAG